jgi:hypothetical protein
MISLWRISSVYGVFEDEIEVVGDTRKTKLQRF